MFSISINHIYKNGLDSLSAMSANRLIDCFNLLYNAKERNFVVGIKINPRHNNYLSMSKVWFPFRLCKKSSLMKKQYDKVIP